MPAGTEYAIVSPFKPTLPPSGYTTPPRTSPGGARRKQDGAVDHVAVRTDDLE
jgi:hypothetical protein